MDRDFLKKGHIALLYNAEEGLTPIIMDEHYLSKPYEKLILRYRLNPDTMHYLRQYDPRAYFKNGCAYFMDSTSLFMYMDQVQDFVWDYIGVTVKFDISQLPDYCPFTNKGLEQKAQEKAVINEALENYIAATNERLLCSRGADQGYMSKLLGKIRIAKRLLGK